MIALVKESSGPGHVVLKDLPEPSAGVGQVKIRVEMAGVCGSDLHILHDDIKLNLQPPAVLGHEFCGVVEKVGEGVEVLTPGDRVTSETTFRSCGQCLHCRSGNYNLCAGKELIGYVHDGCFARYCVVPAQRVHGLPASIPFGEGALCEPLACCVHAVAEQTEVSPADTVLVAGVGTIGLLCAQVARTCGARVVLCGTDADTDRFIVGRQLGFEQIVNVTGGDPDASVRALAGAEGPDVFFECSGAPAAARMGLSVLRRGGRFCQVGLVGSPFEIDFEQIAYKELSVTGSIGSKWTSWRKALALLGSGAVKVGPLTGEPLSITEWEEAFRRFEAKEGLKILLRPE